MTAYTPDGTFVGVSQPVPKENGLLTFKSGIVNLLPVKAAQVYCDLVSCELAGFSMRKSNFETHQSESTDAMETTRIHPFTLGVNGGDEDHSSLCQSRTSDEVLVAYNVSEADSESQDLDTTTCTSVFVHIIPESEWGGEVADHLADPALSVGRQGKPVINSTDTCLTGWPL